MEHGIPVQTIHTSGHASAKDLQRLVKAMAPRKVIPIHTEKPESYEKLFGNVLRVEDGQAVAV
jgi:ribonuclease J